MQLNSLPPKRLIPACGLLMMMLSLDSISSAAVNPQPGEKDTTFATTTNSGGNAIIVQADGNILLGTQSSYTGTTSNPRLVRKKPTGAFDTNFSVTPNNLFGEVFGMALQHDGKIIVAGLASDLPLSGSSYLRLVRLDAQGREDTTFPRRTLADNRSMAYVFNPSYPGQPQPFPILVQPDDKIIVISCTSSGFTLIRLMPDGSLDTSFNSPLKQGRLIPVLLPDGRFLVWNFIGSYSTPTLSRLQRDGQNDPTFTPSLGLGPSILAGTAVLPDGKILLTGELTIPGRPDHYLAVRFLDTGALDSTFSPPISNDIRSPTLLPQSDGRFFLNDIRYMANGLRDITFTPGVTWFDARALQADGKLLQTTPDGPTDRFYNGSATGSLFLANSTITWMPGHHAPMVDEVVFYKADGSLLGRPTRVGTTSNWQLTGATVTAGARVLVNAWQHQGIASNSAYQWQLPVLAVRSAASVTFVGLDASINEGRGANVTVKLSSPLSTPVTVPLKLGGTAIQASDYTLTPSHQIVFQPGEVEKDLLLNTIQDETLEPDKTVTITMGTPVGTASLLYQNPFTITIKSDDLPPSILGESISQAVPLGGAWGFTVAVVNAADAKIEWFKNGHPIGSGSRYDIYLAYGGEAARPTDAGAYQARITKQGITVWSKIYQVVVVDTTAITATCKLGGPLLAKLPAWGKFHCEWAGVGIANGSVTAIGNALKISRATGTEIGDYFCHITPVTDEGNAQSLDVSMAIAISTAPPIITQPAITGRVRQPISLGLGYSENASPPTHWKVSGLPKGLMLAGGSIVGTPLVAGNYRLTVSASNPSGNATPVIVPLLIKALPDATVGIFEGTLKSLQSDGAPVGGRIHLVVSSQGNCTGRIYLRSGSYPLSGTGVLIDDPIDGNNEPFLAFHFELPLPGYDTPVEVGLNIGVASDPQHWIGGSLNPVLSIVMWPRMSEPASYAGLHTVQLRATSGFLGDGFSWLTLHKSGMATWVMRGVDGSTMTSSQMLGKGGKLAIFHQLYAKAGMLNGSLAVSSIGEVTGDLLQTKPDMATSSGAAFGEEILSAHGARYYAPSRGGIVMNLPSKPDNLLVSFFDMTSDDLPAWNDTLTRALTKGAVIVPNRQPDALRFIETLRINPANGGFSGTAEFIDPDPLSTTGKTVARLARFHGVIVNGLDGVSDGRGFVLLPRLRTTPGSSSAVLFDSLPVRIQPN